MANRERGELTLLVGEQTYVLRLTTNACCELEDFSGRTWDQVMAGVNRGSYKDVRLMFWTALRDRHGDIATEAQDSLKTIGTLIDAAGGVEAIHARMRALMLLNADKEEPATGGATRPLDAQHGRTGDNSRLTH